MPVFARFLLLIAALALGAAACVGEVSSVAPDAARAAREEPEDAGEDADDAALDLDGGVDEDAGAELDAGLDGGAPDIGAPDAGPPPPTDAGAPPVDAGPVCDPVRTYSIRHLQASMQQTDSVADRRRSIDAAFNSGVHTTAGPRSAPSSR